MGWSLGASEGIQGFLGFLPQRASSLGTPFARNDVWGGLLGIPLLVGGGIDGMGVRSGDAFWLLFAQGLGGIDAGYAQGGDGGGDEGDCREDCYGGE